jgi:hypothetical protein
MDKPDFFEIADSHATYAPLGNTSLQEAINLVSMAIGYAREQGIEKLLVDATGLGGFDPPTTLERFTLGGQFARAARGAVKVAFVARPEWVDPKRFGLTVARNRGLVGEVFTARAEALGWLLNSDGESKSS